MSNNPTKVVTGPCVFSYLHCWEPAAIQGGKPKYSVSLIIKKTDTVTLNKIKAAVRAAYEEGQSKLKGNGRTIPALEDIQTPLRDGDKKDDPNYAGCYYLNAKSETKPGVVDASCNDILDRAEMYSGVIGRASLSFYSYNVNGNKGIGVGLNHLQKLRDGEPLGGRTRAADDFADEDGEDDFLS